jgi:hypothetical protein
MSLGLFLEAVQPLKLPVGLQASRRTWPFPGGLTCPFSHASLFLHGGHRRGFLSLPLAALPRVRAGRARAPVVTAAVQSFQLSLPLRNQEPRLVHSARIWCP